MPEPLFTACFPLQGIFCLIFFLQFYPAGSFPQEGLHPDLFWKEERLLQRMHVQWVEGGL